MKRYYLVDVSLLDDFNPYCSDEEFMTIAEEQGSVYSEDGFVSAFNNEEINEVNSFLRIIEVKSTSDTTDIINYIKGVIKEWGAFYISEVEGEESPVFDARGKRSELIERFASDGVDVQVYIDGYDVEGFTVPYEELSENLLYEVSKIVENYEALMLKTEERISD